MPEATFREIADNAPVMIWRADRSGQCDWFNRAWLSFTGQAFDDALGKGWTAGVHPDDLAAVIVEREAAMADRRRFELTYRRQTADGGWAWLLDKGAPFERDGDFAGYFGSCIDITIQQHTYDTLQRAYRERDGLLREIYHRVKNNLQQIQGLIALEMGSVKDAAGRKALSALSRQVRAMGLVHQMLLKSSDLEHVSARDFVAELCGAIASSSGMEQRNITVNVIADDIPVDLERAALKGLIINELITNALKHAFPDDRPGTITVRFGIEQPNSSFIEVADDGIGIQPRGRKLKDSNSVGAILIAGLIDQLHGRMTRSGPPGTSVHISFPRSKEEVSQ